MKAIKTWRNIDKDNISIIELNGDSEGRLSVIAEQTTGNIYFAYGGQIIGELNSNGRINWFAECKQSIKKEIKKFVSDITNKKFTGIETDEIIKELSRRNYIAIPTDEIPEYIGTYTVGYTEFCGFKDGYFINENFSPVELKNHLLKITGKGSFATKEDILRELSDLLM